MTLLDPPPPPSLSPLQTPSKPFKRFSRRRFFRYLGALSLTTGIGMGIRVSGYPPLPASLTLHCFTATDYAIFDSILFRLIDPSPDAPDPRSLECTAFLDLYLKDFPSSILWQIRLVLRLVEHTPLLFHGYFRRFTTLAASAQRQVLQGWSESRFLWKRQAFKALKTLAYLSYYRHEKTWGSLQYEGPLVPRGYEGGERETPYASLCAPLGTLPRGIQ
jgi:hypothetical protein